MDLNQLNVFIAAAEYKNFTEASKVLNMVPSTVSYNISMLESALGVKLFHRNINKLSLTSYGEEFLKDAYEITAHVNNSVERLKRGSLRKSGRLHIGFIFPEFLVSYLHELDAFHRKYPEVNISYMRYDSMQIYRLMQNNELDLAFESNGLLSGAADIVWRSLYRDPLKLLIHRSNPLSAYDTLTLRQLRNESFVILSREYNPYMSDLLSHMFMDAGVVPFFTSETNNLNMAVISVALNRGIMIVPEKTVDFLKLPPEVVACGIDSPLAFYEVGIAWNQKTNNPFVRKFLFELSIQEL